MESRDKQEQILELSRLLDQWAEENLGTEPDWKPLEDALPYQWCEGFMWMNHVVEAGTVIHLYKHGITRRYLNLDEAGRAYRWTGAGYEEIPVVEAIEAVYEEIESMGWDRTTKYDDEFKAAKYEAYRQEGWTVLTTRGLSGVKIPDSVIDISKSSPRDSRPGNDGR